MSCSHESNPTRNSSPSSPISTPLATDELLPEPTPFHLSTRETSLLYADELCGVDHTNVMVRHYQEEQAFLGRGMLSLICEVLYGHPLGADYCVDLDTKFALLGQNTPPSQMLAHLEYLVRFVVDDSTGANKTIGEFIGGIKTLPEWKFASHDELRHAWDVLWNVLFFTSKNIPLYTGSLIGSITRLFPPVLPRSLSGLRFSISLSDLSEVEIQVVPTVHLEEHLTFDGDHLRVLKLDEATIKCCLVYHDNRIAKAFGIETLGQEVISSANALYGKGSEYKKAKDLDLINFGEELGYKVYLMFIRGSDGQRRPQVLAHRALALQKLVAYRRSWWPTLLRDMKHQSTTQPVIFYGVILAVISVVCGVIQTIASVWALAIALRSLPTGN